MPKPTEYVTPEPAPSLTEGIEGTIYGDVIGADRDRDARSPAELEAERLRAQLEARSQQRRR